ncbi:hypothetical protein RRG08_019274 [Elysia crispata]|uniref:Uncharacterized protein n=1 Tax=Elysia crispata TaxID=231223 RepID=A0AAE0YA88_9GAST|nr:hypothetical protein RRG08_019274 [Elysia crispata]
MNDINRERVRAGEKDVTHLRLLTEQTAGHNVEQTDDMAVLLRMTVNVYSLVEESGAICSDAGIDLCKVMGENWLNIDWISEKL